MCRNIHAFNPECYPDHAKPKKRKQLDKIKGLLRIKIVKIEKSEKKGFVFNCPKCGRKMVLIEQSHRLRASPEYLTIKRGLSAWWQTGIMKRYIITG